MDKGVIKTVTNIYLGGECYFPDINGKKFSIKKGRCYGPDFSSLYTHEISGMNQYWDVSQEIDGLTAMKCFTYNNEVLVLGTDTSHGDFYGTWATRLDNVVWETGGGK